MLRNSKGTVLGKRLTPGEAEERGEESVGAPWIKTRATLPWQSRETSKELYDCPTPSQAHTTQNPWQGRLLRFLWPRGSAWGQRTQPLTLVPTLLPQEAPTNQGRSAEVLGPRS